MTKPYKELLTKIKCWLGFHEWRVITYGKNHSGMMHLHVLADTFHSCKFCRKQRNWLHVSAERLLEMHKRGTLDL